MVRISRAAVVDGGILLYWVNEVFVVRRGSVWLTVDTTRNSLDIHALPGTPADEIALALDEIKRHATRPDTWPTQRLPTLPQP